MLLVVTLWAALATDVTHDFTIDTTKTANPNNIIEGYDFVIGEAEAPATWDITGIVDCTANTRVTANTVSSKNLTFTGAGHFYIDANVTVKGIDKDYAQECFIVIDESKGGRLIIG